MFWCWKRLLIEFIHRISISNNLYNVYFPKLLNIKYSYFTQVMILASPGLMFKNQVRSDRKIQKIRILICFILKHGQFDIDFEFYLVIGIRVANYHLVKYTQRMSNKSSTKFVKCMNSLFLYGSFYNKVNKEHILF